MRIELSYTLYFDFTFYCAGWRDAAPNKAQKAVLSLTTNTVYIWIALSMCPLCI